MDERSPGAQTHAPYDDPRSAEAHLPPLAPYDAARSLTAARWKLLLLFGVYAAVFVIAMPLLAETVGPWPTLAVLLVVLVAIGRWIASFWVCPRCKRPLGRSLTPPACQHCGQRLRS
jgi:hypothetical protein